MPITLLSLWMREGNIQWLLVSEGGDSHVSGYHYETIRTNLLTWLQGNEA